MRRPLRRGYLVARFTRIPTAIHRDAVKTKSWAAIAFNYNGPSYKTYRYDEKVSAAYRDYCRT